jgi:hypothetical protein
MIDERQVEIIDRYAGTLAKRIFYLLEATFIDLEQRKASKKVFAKEIYDTFADLKYTIENYQNSETGS